MRYVTATRWVFAGVIVLAACSLRAQVVCSAEAKTAPGAKAGADANAWRYVYFQSRWWYWLPENRWVYWQDSRWNDFPAPSSVRGETVIIVPSRTDEDQVRPYYGHAESPILYGPSSDMDEIRPFYGHALPGRFVGPFATPNADIRPFYGHAGSAYAY